MGRSDETPLWLARLLEDHGAALVLYARQWCDCPEDVVQESLLRLVRQRKQPEHLVAWMYRVVRNGAISAARGKRRRAQRESRAAADEAWFERSSETIDAQQATAALAELELELREVVVARIWGGLTFAEIGKLAGISLSAAHRRYEEGIQQLQARLEKSCTNKTNQGPKR